MMTIATVLFFATLTERLTRYFVDALPPTRAIVPRLVAMAIGVALAFGFNADAFAALGYTAAYPWLALVLSGVLYAGGANLINDVISAPRVVAVVPAEALRSS